MGEEAWGQKGWLGHSRGRKVRVLPSLEAFGRRLEALQWQVGGKWGGLRGATLTAFLRLGLSQHPKEDGARSPFLHGATDPLFLRPSRSCLSV